MQFSFKQIVVGSPAYEQMKELRLEVLLRPIGVPESYIDPIREQGDILLGAFKSDALLACCILTRRDPDTMQLRQMAVASHKQGSGVGRALLDFAEAIAAENGASKMILHARKDIAGFYTACQYQLAGEEFEEVGKPHLPMQRALKKQPKLLS